MDQLLAMRVYRRVAELGSFSGAAESLHLSNAAVSQHVRQLEAHLGTLLMHRTTRRLSLTEAGRLYLEQCSAILDSISETEALVSRMQIVPRGRLKLSLPLIFGIKYVAPVLPEFLARCTEVQVDCELSDRFVDLVEEGFDVALRIVTKLPDSALVATRLATVSRLVCGAPAYFRVHGIAAVPADLVRHECIVSTFLASPDEWIFRSKGGEIRVKVKGSRRAYDTVGARAALVAGHGVAVVPRFLVEDDLKAGRLVAVLARYTVEPHSLWAVRHRSRHESAKVRAFLDFLSQSLGRVPPWEQDGRPGSRRRGRSGRSGNG